MAGLVHTVLKGRSCQEMLKGTVSPTTHPMRESNGRTGGGKAQSCWRGASPFHGEAPEERISIKESRVPSARRGHRTTSIPSIRTSGNLSMASVKGEYLASLSYYLKKPHP